jgi:hypothetical protein
MSMKSGRAAVVVKKLLANLGYNITTISSTKPTALLSFDGNPRALRYLKKSGEFLITGKVEDGRSLFVFPLDDKNRHPFVRAVQAALDVSLIGGDEKEAIRRRLMGFYSLYRPASAAEVLGAAAEEIPMLGDQPPWVVIKPWEDMSVQERIEKIIRTEREDNSQVSTAPMSVEHGCNFCGPVSGEKLSVEAERLYKIMKSVIKNGFMRHDFKDGDIRADILVQTSGNWKWLVKSGQHRVAVLSALGYREFPIRVESIVCRDEVDFWPQVLAGNYSREMALRVFDNIFSGVGVHERYWDIILAEAA